MHFLYHEINLTLEAVVCSDLSWIKEDFCRGRMNGEKRIKLLQSVVLQQAGEAAGYFVEKNRLEMGESYFAHKRDIKRRLMEMNNSSNNHHQVGAEVRRIHVIYFLSRNDRIEHPHLIRVHHLSRNGVHLRDVKRWLSELRGKEMPESFSWSYKRRYKSGYVWQDLLDEDLITPISDNEYVLKGSEISSSSSTTSSPVKEDSNVGKKYSMQKEEEHQQQEQEENNRQELGKMASPDIEEESQTFSSEKSSTLTDDYDRDLSSKQETHDEEAISDDRVHEKQQPNSSLHKNLSKKKNHKKASSDAVAPEEKTGVQSSASQPSFSKSKSYSNGASHLFRNLITCGAIDTNDSAMVTITRSNKKPSMNAEFSSSSKLERGTTGFSKDLLQKADKLGGSQRVIGSKWLQPRQNSGRKSFDGVRASPKNNSEFSSQNPNPAYMPIYGPQCAQCGKHFKPAKMHAHMKSCKGMKTWAKYNGRGISANSAENAAESSTESQENLIPGYFLTHR